MRPTPALYVVMAILAATVIAQPAAGETIARFDPAASALTIQRNTTDLVDARFVFWQDKWKWMGLQQTAARSAERLQYKLSARDPGTRFSLDGEFEVESPSSATMRIDFREMPTGALDVFGGIVFKLSFDALALDGIKTKPELLPNRMGWQWDIEPGKPPLKVMFDAPVAGLEFERGYEGEIRAYLLRPNNTHDAGKVRMTVSLPGRFESAVSERLVPRSPDWAAVPFDPWRVPLDLSFLNEPEKPAGKRGFIQARGENLEFEDGTRTRFWGTNITAAAIFGYTNPDQVRLLAKRLSRLGFNLVRIHHHDSAWVRPNIFGSSGDRTDRIDAASLERVHWWVKCLRDEGIYVWLDLDVGRQYTRADGIEAFDEMAKGHPSARPSGYAYVNPSIQQRMKAFAEGYLQPVNRHTGLALKDDPAVIAVLITNENDITYHFGNGLLPDKGVPWHNARYMKLAGDFARRHNLDAEATWRAWTFGPSKLFLADLERQLHADLTDHLRSIGVRVPIVGTNFWGRMGAAGLPALAAGDLIDVHTYGIANEVAANPRYRNGLTDWIASGAVAGKPVTVTEWNVEPFPVFDRFQVPLQLAASAGLQGWAALMQYAYSQESPAHGSSPSNWHAYNDPALLATMPAAALMYRQGHVSEGAKTYYLDLSKDDVFGRHTGPDTSRAIRTLAARGKLRIGLPKVTELSWLKATTPPTGAEIIRSAAFDAIPRDQTKVCSDTAETCRDWKAGVLTVDTARTQLASGWIGGQPIALRDVSLDVTTPNASIAVQSLDGAAIPEARQLLISMSAQAVPRSQNALPFVAEPIVGKLTIRAAPGLSLFRLIPDGRKVAHAAGYANGRYMIDLNKDGFANWWLLEAAGK